MDRIFEILATTVVFKISPLAADWVNKGFHIRIDGVELAMRPGRNGTIVFKPVFSSTPAKVVKDAIRKAEAKLDEAETRRTVHRDAVRARDYLRSMRTERSLARSGELNFLIKAIEKRGLK
ncbi:MAG: hypothetical protein DRI57_08750 [Deltaproteobacteria bacterium]|nr:MAG: hypothetical protein DRI57_08750 [Deltaproteobacteria bacterium]